MKGKVRHFILGAVSSILTKMTGRKPSSLSVLIFSNLILWSLARRLDRKFSKIVALKWSLSPGHRNHFISRYQELMDHFLIHFGDLKNQPTKENIHQVRVTIKKIRAALSLLEQADQSFDKAPYLVLFDELFQTAGDVREAQVNQSLVEAFPEINAFESYLYDAEFGARVELQRFVKRFDTSKLRRLNRELNQVAGKVGDKKIEEEAKRLIGDHLKAIKEFLGDPQKLHRIRKEIRTLSEVLKYTGDQSNSYSRLATMIDQLNTLIGDWHDRQVLIDSIAKFEDLNPSAGMTGFVRIIADTKSDIEGLEKRIFGVLGSGF